jgi:hypothetical protein
MNGDVKLGMVNILFKTQDDGFSRHLAYKLIDAFKARITCHDWYADLRINADETVARNEKAGTPLSNPRMFHDDIDSAERTAGRRIGLAVPIETGGYMIGSVTKHDIVLTACCSLSEDKNVTSLVGFLQALDIVEKVEVT